MCTPLALIHTHQAERVHPPWQEHTGLSIKPPGTDQLTVSRYATLAQASSDASESGLSLGKRNSSALFAVRCGPET